MGFQSVLENVELVAVVSIALETIRAGVVLTSDVRRCNVRSPELQLSLEIFGAVAGASGQLLKSLLRRLSVS